MNTNHTAAAQMLTAREYWLIDVLPKQVPANGGGQYFAVERRFLAHPHIDRIFRRFASAVLRLNCYYDLHLSRDGEHWTRNPDPVHLAARIESIAGSQDRLWLLIGDAEALITVSGDDAYMTLYRPDAALLELIRVLAGAEGLFVWGPRNE